jgi:hypothetical protein
LIKKVFNNITGGICCDTPADTVASWHTWSYIKSIKINYLLPDSFGLVRAYRSAGVKSMSLRNKVVVFALGAIAAVAGLGLAFTSLKHAVIVVASAVWGS